MANKYKSKWEQNVAGKLEELNVPVKYEEDRLKYTIPESVHTYSPDFTITKKIFIEAKGKFTAQDRKKHLLLKAQHPDKTIHILFQNANNRLRKGSPTTYAMWCTKNGISYSHKEIKPEWITTKSTK